MEIDLVVEDLVFCIHGSQGFPKDVSKEKPIRVYYRCGVTKKASGVWYPLLASGTCRLNASISTHNEYQAILELLVLAE